MTDDPNVERITFVDGRALTRFRADPARVRVAVRPVGRLTLVTITERASGRWVCATASGPRKALALALREAERRELPGIDLSMGWAYQHPMFRPDPNR